MDFAELFEGRDDAWGALHGECVKEFVTDDHFHDHLYDEGQSLGVYPLVQDELIAVGFEAKHGIDGGAYYVHWGCSDVDNPDDLDLAFTLACNLQAALEALGLVSWIEMTKSKGYHVWVFADDWVPAVVMRRALLVAHQIAGVAPTEVNPKSLDGGKTGIGNYVNLPYPYGWQNTYRRVVIENGEVIPPNEFVERALANRNSFDSLYAAAKLYVEPKRQVVQISEPSAEAVELSRCLDGLTYKVWIEGPMEGRDRSGAMARFCHLCRDRGIAAGTCLVLLRDMDARLGKFIDRDDREEQLLRLVENAYGT